MKNRHSKMVRKRVKCPECGHEFTYREQRGIKRFQPRAKVCPNCDVGFR